MNTRATTSRYLRTASLSVIKAATPSHCNTPHSDEIVSSASFDLGGTDRSRKRKNLSLKAYNQEKQFKLYSSAALGSSSNEKQRSRSKLTQGPMPTGTPTFELNRRDEQVPDQDPNVTVEKKLSLANLDDSESKENSEVKNNIDGAHTSHSDEDDELAYMQIRENNLKANQEFLARIGMQKAKEDLEASVKKKKILPTQRGLRQQKKVEEPLPRRLSLRIRRINPEGVPLPDPEPVEEHFVEQRLPETVTMEERQYSKNQTELEDLKPFLSTICSLKTKETIHSLTTGSAEHKKLVSNIGKIKITEDQVAKVVPGRVYSVAWHPSQSHLMAIAGDVHGYIGLWNVLAGDSEEDIVKAFHPHIKPVTHLLVPPTDSHKLYTSSYDATLRCGDFEKGVFDLVFSVPEEHDDLFRNFDFIGNGSSMLVSHFRGLVSLVDTRTASTSAEKVFKVSQYSLRKVSVHPVSTHYFITAGRDAKINLWDLRSMNAKSPIPVQTMKDHFKAIASAYFSPISGNQILSSSSDDTIQIHTASEGMNFELTSRIRHNNHTGRWLTPFQPIWHPTVEGIFVTGSMARPRQIEVFDSNGKVVQNLNGDYLASVCSLNAFHPTQPSCLVGANSSGRLHVFK